MPTYVFSRTFTLRTTAGMSFEVKKGVPFKAPVIVEEEIIASGGECLDGAAVLTDDVPDVVPTVEESARMGIVRQPISEDDIIKRCLYGMVNEGARLLEQGIALRPSDIDITYLTGYGFPAHHGGPMYLADRIGLANVLADIRQLHAQYGYWWQPAPLLEQLVREGRRFADLQPAP